MIKDLLFKIVTKKPRYPFNQVLWLIEIKNNIFIFLTNEGNFVCVSKFRYKNLLHIETNQIIKSIDIPFNQGKLDVEKLRDLSKS